MKVIQYVTYQNTLSCLDGVACLPIHMSDHFWAHLCKVTFKQLLQTLRSHIQSFETLGQLLKIPPPLSGQIQHSARGMGSPGADAKFSNHRMTPSV